MLADVGEGGRLKHLSERGRERERWWGDDHAVHGIARLGSFREGRRGEERRGEAEVGWGGVVTCVYRGMDRCWWEVRSLFEYIYIGVVGWRVSEVSESVPRLGIEVF